MKGVFNIFEKLLIFTDVVVLFFCFCSHSFVLLNLAIPFIVFFFHHHHDCFDVTFIVPVFRQGEVSVTVSTCVVVFDDCRMASRS